MKLINIISEARTWRRDTSRDDDAYSRRNIIPDKHTDTIKDLPLLSYNPKESDFKDEYKKVNVPNFDADFYISKHWRFRQYHRFGDEQFAIRDFSNRFNDHRFEIDRLPYGGEFLIIDGQNYKTPVLKTLRGNKTAYIIKTLLSPHMASKAKWVFRESVNNPVKLGDLVAMSKGMEDADFWIEYRGSANTVGKPSKEYGPYKLGIKVTATDRLDPRFLYYAFMNLQQQGHFAKMAHGTTNLVNLRIRDLANIPLGNG